MFRSNKKVGVANSNTIANSASEFSSYEDSYSDYNPYNELYDAYDVYDSYDNEETFQPIRVSNKKQSGNSSGNPARQVAKASDLARSEARRSKYGD
jgi:hypothetical protein